MKICTKEKLQKQSTIIFVLIYLNFDSHFFKSPFPIRRNYKNTKYRQIFKFPTIPERIMRAAYITMLEVFRLQIALSSVIRLISDCYHQHDLRS